MKNLMYVAFLLVGFFSAQAQQKTESTTQSMPEGQWTVHKQYDEKGNLIAKDSTYSYSSINGRPVSPEEADSLLKSLKKHIPEEFMSSGFFDNLDGNSISELMNGFDSQEMRKLMNDFHDGKFDDLLQGFDLNSLDSFFEDFSNDDFTELLEEFNFDSIDESFFKDFYNSQDEETQKLLRKHNEDIQNLLKDQETKSKTSKDQNRNK